MSKKRNLNNIKGILTDIDGTLYFKGKPIPNSIETISKLRKAGLKLLFLTNKDSKSPSTVYKTLQEYGFDVNRDEIFTPIIAVKEFLQKHPDKISYFVTTQEGAKLLGTQGNNYYLDHNGEPIIDTGSFVYMIAKAANVVPNIFGKPSKEYFLQALEKLGFKPNEVLVIGDDLESDIHGAINAGIKGILVKTGKGQLVNSTRLRIKPYLILASFSSLKEVIEFR
jgi:ribonucleotide monophosphatase NagD (HAD superfamily)